MQGTRQSSESELGCPSGGESRSAESSPKAGKQSILMSLREANDTCAARDLLGKSCRCSERRSNLLVDDGIASLSFGRLAMTQP